MGMQKQIDEMARTFGGCHITPNCKVCCAYSGSTDCTNKTSAERLYNAGYRKIPENSVVLTREELNDLEYKAYARGVNSFNTLHEKQLSKVRKETADKFAERLKIRLFEYMDNDVSYDEFCKANIVCGEIDEICKEITEGNV